MARRARSADAIGGGGAAASHASHADLLYTRVRFVLGFGFLGSSTRRRRDLARLGGGRGESWTR